MTRADGRAADQLRPVEIIPNFTKFAEGSCLVEMGDTVVLCNASVEEKLPPHVRSGGWITAEYSMLPIALSSTPAARAKTAAFLSQSFTASLKSHSFACETFFTV